MGFEKVKTSLEIPDPIFRRAKSLAAQRGISLRAFVTEAVEGGGEARGRLEKRRKALGEACWRSQTAAQRNSAYQSDCQERVRED